MSSLLIYGLLALSALGAEQEQTSATTSGQTVSGIARKSNRLLEKSGQVESQIVQLREAGGGRKSSPRLHEHPTLQSMLAENNRLRREQNLPLHQMSPELCLAAQFHAEYMARTGDFRHDANLGPLGRTRKFGYDGELYENIAWGQRSVRETFDDWKQSPGHWQAITSGDTDLAGFGYAVSADGDGYWVGMYGSQADRLPATPRP